MEFGEIKYKQAQINPKINPKIDLKIVSISDRSVNIRKYCKNSNKNNFNFQYLRLLLFFVNWKKDYL